MANRKQITNCQKNVINNFLRFLIDEDGILNEKKSWEKNLKKKLTRKEIWLIDNRCVLMNLN